MGKSIPQHSIQIKFQGEKYISIGEYMDSGEGIMRLFPDTNTLTDWKLYLENSNALVQIWSLGLLLNNFLEDEKSFEVEFSKELAEIINKNKSLINKWFSDNGNILSNIFLDFVYGYYSNYGSGSILIKYNSDGEEVDYLPGENIEFNDGSILEFSQQNITWSDISNMVFIENKYFNEFESDLNTIIESLK